MKKNILSSKPARIVLIAIAAMALMLLIGCKQSTTRVAPSERPPECPPCDCGPEQTAAQDAPLHLPAEKGPKTAILYHLTSMYVPVEFNHLEHTNYAESCSTCHHHHSDIEATPACRECHGLPFKTLAKPGLKGAYHRQCMNCHREMDGPLDCEACHALREGAEPVLPAELAKQNAPKVAKLDHLAKEYQAVQFNHELHVVLTDACDDCHHHHGEVEVTPPCRECHNHAASNGEKKLGLKDAYHQQCRSCHRGRGEGPLSCEDCHPKAGE
ncbi:MAG: cytochrome c family protein [Deltaproteobacteria bacterium]|nr:cytochrome c family protein [Deltaproteobacteria bacterium]